MSVVFGKLISSMAHDSPLIFASAGDSPRLSREVAAGKARRLAHGLYTRDLRTAPDELIAAHWMEVTAHHLPGALIADRSTVRAGPDDGGFLFVVHARVRPLELPGLTIVP